MRAQFRSRLRLILAFVFLVALCILIRLYFIQIVYGQEYSQKADRQFASGGNGLFDRGAIYFTRKDGTFISAATLSTGFLAATAKKGQVYIKVAHRLSDAAGQVLAAKNIRGMQILRERWRHYPGGSL